MLRSVTHTDKRLLTNYVLRGMPQKMRGLLLSGLRGLLRGLRGLLLKGLRGMLRGPLRGLRGLLRGLPNEHGRSRSLNECFVEMRNEPR
jgi:hypothetical protein